MYGDSTTRLTYFLYYFVNPLEMRPGYFYIIFIFCQEIVLFFGIFYEIYNSSNNLTFKISYLK